MTVWAEVTTSSFRYTRIDAEFYNPKYLAEDFLWTKLSKHIRVVPLKHIQSRPVRTGRTPKDREIFEGDDIISFIKTDTLREGRIEYDRCEFLPARAIGQSDLIPNDAILVTIIGATHDIIGRAAIRRYSDPQAVTNQNVAVIQLGRDVDPYFFMSYLNSSYGRNQLWRHSRQTEQVNLNCREVERIIVPVFPKTEQKEISKLARASFQSLDSSTRLYTQAQNLLEQELGLDKLELSYAVGYDVKIIEIVENNRVDAEFYHFKFKPYLEKAANYRNGCLPLSNVTSRVLPNFDAQKHTKHFDYVEIGDVSTSDGSYAMNRIAAKELPANAKIKLNGGEVIVSKVRPTRGAIAIIEDKLERDTICSGAFYVYRSKVSMYREIIWLYLRCMKSVFEKYHSGTSYPTIESHYISKFPVPNFDETLAQEIRDLIIQSKQSRREAEKLLKQAIRLAEKLIEKGAK